MVPMHSCERQPTLHNIKVAKLIIPRLCGINDEDSMSIRMRNLTLSNGNVDAVRM